MKEKYDLLHINKDEGIFIRISKHVNNIKIFDKMLSKREILKEWSKSITKEEWDDKENTRRNNIRLWNRW